MLTKSSVLWVKATKHKWDEEGVWCWFPPGEVKKRNTPATFFFPLAMKHHVRLLTEPQAVAAWAPYILNTLLIITLTLNGRYED